MSTLKEILLAPQHHDAIIADCVHRVEAHVAKTSGLKGLSLKAGLAAMKSAWPNALPRATELLLPEFAAALDPFYSQFRNSGQKDFAAFLEPRRTEACAAILVVADARAARTRHRAMARVYQKLRGTLAAELDYLLPGLVRGLSTQLRRTIPT